MSYHLLFLLLVSYTLTPRLLAGPIEEWNQKWNAAVQQHDKAAMESLMAQEHAPMKNQDWTDLFQAVWESDIELVEALLQSDVDIEQKDINDCTVLHWAAEMGDDAMVALLLRNHANVNAVTIGGNTALTRAATHGHINVMQLLVCGGANVNFQAPTNQSALHRAAYSGHTDAVKFLLANGAQASIYLLDVNGNIPLHVASIAGHLEVVKVLVQACQSIVDSQKYVDLCFGKTQGITQKRNSDGRTPLHFAALKGHVEIVKFLAQVDNVNVDIQDRNGDTPLHFAAQHNHLDVVKFLIEMCKLDMRVKDKIGRTCLHWAAQKGYLDLIKFLVQALKKIQSDINLKDEKEDTPLHLAALNGHLEIVKFLIQDCYVDAQIKDKNKSTPLHLAALNGHLDVVKFLVKECKIDVEIKDIYGSTPLFWASAKGYLGVVDFLVKECQVDIQTEDIEGITAWKAAAANHHLDVLRFLMHAYLSNDQINSQSVWEFLHWAVSKNHLDVVQVLIQHLHIDAQIKNPHGETPLHVAALKGHLEIMKFLINICKVDVQIADQKIGTALHWAAAGGQLDAVKFLITDCQVNPEVRNRFNGTPLDTAATYGHLNIVEFLINDCGADIESKTQLGYRPLLSAAQNGRLDVVKFLVINCHANTEAKDCLGYTPFIWAARNGHVEVVKFLFSKLKGPAGVINEVMQEALRIAAERGRLEVVKLLVEYYDVAVDIYYKDPTLLPLHLAAEGYLQEAGKKNPSSDALRKHESVVDFLIEHMLLKNKSEFFSLVFPNKDYSENVRERDHEYFVLILERFRKNHKSYQHLCYMFDKDHDTPLMASIKQGNIRKLKAFLKAGIDPDVNEIYSNQSRSLDKKRNFDNKTFTFPIHMAAKLGALEIMELLLAHGANIDIQDKQGKTPLHIAMEQSHWDIVNLLLNKKANIHLRNFYPGIGWAPGSSEGPSEHENALHVLIRIALANIRQYGDAAWNLIAPCFETLLNIEGVQLNARNYEGDTVLHILLKALKNPRPNTGFESVKRGVVHIFIRLLQQGACLSDTNKTGCTVLELLLQNAAADLLEGIIQHGFLTSADLINYQDSVGNSVLHHAVIGNNAPMIEYLVAQTHDLEHQDGRQHTKLFLEATNLVGQTALHGAARLRHTLAARKLIDAGAYINAQDSVGQTALVMAAQNGDLYGVEELLKCGAAVNVADNNGDTALHHGAAGGYTQVVELLLEHEADVNAVNMQGNTPLHLACIDKHLDTVKVLIEHEGIFYVSLLNQEGRTLVHLAAQTGNKEIFDYIAPRWQSALHTPDDSGETAAHIAARLDPEIINSCIEFQLDFRMRNQRGQTPMDVAKQINKTKGIINEIKKGVLWSVSDKVDYDAKQPGFDAKIYIQNAITEADLDLVNYCFKKGFSLQALDKDILPFLQALLIQHDMDYDELFEALFKRQKQIVMEDVYGLELLYLAAKHSGVRILRFLLKYAANFEGQTVDAQALLKAAEQNSNPCVAIYLKQTYPNGMFIPDAFDDKATDIVAVKINAQKVTPQQLAQISDCLSSALQGPALATNNVVRGCQLVEIEGRRMVLMPLPEEKAPKAKLSMNLPSEYVPLIGKPELLQKQKADTQWLSGDQLANIGHYLVGRANNCVTFIPTIDAHLDAATHGSLEEALRANATLEQPLALAINLAPQGGEVAGMGNHWVLVIVLPLGNGKYQGFILDPLGNQAYRMAIRALRYRIETMYGINNIDMETPTYVFQQDQHNCGVWVLHFLERLMHQWAYNRAGLVQDSLNLRHWQLDQGLDINRVRQRYLNIWNTIVHGGQGDNSTQDDDDDDSAYLEDLLPGQLWRGMLESDFKGEDGDEAPGVLNEAANEAIRMAAQAAAAVMMYDLLKQKAQGR